MPSMSACEVPNKTLLLAKYQIFITGLMKSSSCPVRRHVTSAILSVFHPVAPQPAALEKWCLLFFFLSLSSTGRSCEAADIKKIDGCRHTAASASTGHVGVRRWCEDPRTRTTEENVLQMLARSHLSLRSPLMWSAWTLFGYWIYVRPLSLTI